MCPSLTPCSRGVHAVKACSECPDDALQPLLLPSLSSPRCVRGGQLSRLPACRFVTPCHGDAACHGQRRRGGLGGWCLVAGGGVVGCVREKGVQQAVLSLPGAPVQNSHPFMIRGGRRQVFIGIAWIWSWSNLEWGMEWGMECPYWSVPQTLIHSPSPHPIFIFKVGS